MGFYAVVPRGAPLPSQLNVLAFGSRLAGPGSIAQIALPRAVSPTDATMDDLGKRRAEIGGKAEKPIVLSAEEQKAVADFMARNRPRLEAERARFEAEKAAAQ